MRLKRISTAAVMTLLLGVILPMQAQVVIRHTFSNTPDGAQPLQVVWTNGLFYGCTASGGTTGNGSIFTFNTNSGVFATIYSFTGVTNNGSLPNNVLVTGSAIYGTTQSAGTNYLGTTYSLGVGGSGFVPLYSFGLLPDGEYPQSALILNGTTLYGTTTAGGHTGANADGTIFKVNTDGTGYGILHSFTNSPDGAQPQSELVLGGSTFYGTASVGGVNSNGCIFAINISGAGYTNLYSFSNNPDSGSPNFGLVLNAGVLYGIGTSGGSNNNGTIFAINTNGTGYRILHHFSSFTGNTDGAIPKATLTFSGGYLFGTTVSGGINGGGTLFLINTNGTGFATLASFTNGASSGWSPHASVIRVGSSVWGTTYQGSGATMGTFYSLPLPAVIAQPQSLGVGTGDSATFTVNAADDRQISYAWYFNTNTLLAGQNTNTLTLINVTNNNAGAYTVVMTDSFASVTSSPAMLTLAGNKPAITQNAQAYTVTNGLNASFTNVASGSSPLFYQWYLNTNTLVISGVNLTVLTISPATTNQAGYYTAIVTNAFGSATSSPALLTVVLPPAKPVITQQPQNFTVTNGYNATFTNVATSDSPLFYQWYFNTNTAVGGATNSILILTFVSTNQAGFYTVAVSNSSGSVTSSPAKLTVISTKPIIFTQPQPFAATNGQPFTFSVLAAGQKILTYQWYTNRVFPSFALANQTNSSVSFAAATNKLAGAYLVVIANTLGKATSDAALLTILTKPVMTLQPQDVSVANGDPVTFIAAASGPGPLKYQWYFQTNTLVSGATNTSYTFNSAPNLAGFYDVRVTNSFGSVTSSFALLTLSSPPDILSFTVNPGSGSASFTFTNLPNSTNRLWASTNLASTNFWHVIATNVMAASGQWLFTETNSAKTNKARFYRVSTP